MRMTDVIEEFIKELFEEDNDYIEIQRNDLAEHFNCVPSQINYVISTRFKPSQGYYVESKRGGGGHITIKKIKTSTLKPRIDGILISQKTAINEYQTITFCMKRHGLS